MNFIFEGPDNSGKTTLIETLRQELAANNIVPITMKFSSLGLSDPLKEKELQEIGYLHAFLKLFSNKTNISIICDRFHFGEYVYGYLIRGYESNIFQWEEIFKLSRPEVYDKTILIYVTATYEELLRREDNLSLCKEKKKFLELQRFEEAYRKSHLKKIKLINNTINDLEKNKEMIRKVVREMIGGSN